MPTILALSELQSTFFFYIRRNKNFQTTQKLYLGQTLCWLLLCFTLAIALFAKGLRKSNWVVQKLLKVSPLNTAMAEQLKEETSISKPLHLSKTAFNWLHD